MLRRIEFKAFKSLENIEIKLGRINVFIGANGSGKSNLLEGIGILGAAANGRVDDEALKHRGVRPGLPALYKSSFKGSRPPSEIRFSAENAGALYSVGLFNPMNAPEPAWRFKTEILKYGAIKIGRSPRSKEQLDPYEGYIALKSVELPKESPAKRLLVELRQYAIYSPDTATLRGLVTDNQSRDPMGLHGGRLAEAVHDIFTRTEPPDSMPDLIRSSVLELIDWTNGLGASGPGSVPISKNIPQPNLILRFRDRFMADGRDYLSGYDASEGALFVLFMAVLVHHKSCPPVLAVDNFDHGLNPRLAKALTRKICEWTSGQQDRQLLLTSHNPLVLDGLPLRDDEIRLFAVERSRRGKTVCRRIEVDESLLQMADKGIPLSQQWVMGTFGGVPANL
jgi:predicted ATPase